VTASNDQRLRHGVGPRLCFQPLGMSGLIGPRSVEVIWTWVPAQAAVPEAERRVVLCRRLLGIGPNPSTKDAELIAFRVGEYHPRRVTLPDIGPPSTEGKETFDFCGLIDRTEVRMESVLACLLLRNRHEQQARHPIRSRPDLELVRGVAHDNPAQGLGPPSTKRDRIVSVDDDLLPNEIHVAHSARSVSQADPEPAWRCTTSARLVALW
jgi:hypothetical protein